MSVDYQPPAEFVELLHRIAAGENDRSPRQEVNEAIHNDPAALDYYLDATSTEPGLQNTTAAAPLELPLSLADDERSNKRRRVPLPFIIAAAVTFLAAWGMAVMVTVDRERIPTVGNWIGGNAVAWTDNRQQPSPGQPVHEGRGRLDHGVARLKLDCGAAVAIAGPAEFILRDGHRLRLELGALRAQLPAGQQWLSIEAVNQLIVTRGADFGVIVSEDNLIQIHVFDGELSINRQIYLRKNEALEIDPVHRKSHEIPLNPSKFPAKHLDS